MNIITNLKPLLLPYVFEVLVLLLSLVVLLIGFSAGKSKDRRLPPGPPTWPVIGNLAGMVMNRPTSKWIHRVMDEMQTEIACFRFAGVHVIAVASEVIAREALHDKDAVLADRAESYSADYMSVGYKSLIFSHYGDQWKKMRKVMASDLMSPERMNMLLGARNVEADNLLAYVHNLYERSETKVNVRDIVRTYCHAVMMRLMFGRRFFKQATENGALGPMEKEHLDAIFDALPCIFSFRVSDYVPFLRGWDFDGYEKKIREAGENINKYNNLIIDERIHLWRKNGGKEDVEDWLDILITLKDTDGEPLLTPEEIRAQCREICLGSIDNASNNVEWTFAEMLNQPEILQKAVDELDRVVGKDRLVQESDIPNLNYVKSCSRESFRLHPLAAFLTPHVALEDTTLAGYHVPKGSQILVSRPGLGRNPKIWDEPNVYEPERHLSGDGCSAEVNLTEPDMRLVSFSAGRRNCVAIKLGTYMIVMLLARLLQGFNWSFPTGQVDLVEGEESFLMTNPLVASVEPRLAKDMYPQFRN